MTRHSFSACALPMACGTFSELREGCSRLAAGTGGRAREPTGRAITSAPGRTR